MVHVSSYPQNPLCRNNSPKLSSPHTSHNTGLSMLLATTQLNLIRGPEITCVFSFLAFPFSCPPTQVLPRRPLTHCFLVSLAWLHCRGLLEGRRRGSTIVAENQSAVEIVEEAEVMNVSRPWEGAPGGSIFREERRREEDQV